MDRRPGDVNFARLSVGDNVRGVMQCDEAAKPGQEITVKVVSVDSSSKILMLKQVTD